MHAGTTRADPANQITLELNKLEPQDKSCRAYLVVGNDGGLAVSRDRGETWAFEERGMHRVEWRCDPANTRSIASAERLGMTYEGILRGDWVINGERRDTMVYALLATDPRP